MNFTLHQLKIFMVVADRRSITKAAEELHMTQPAVSIQLKKLQDQFKTPLTEIIGRQLHVTEFGKELLVLAEKILDDVNSISYHSENFRGMLSGKLKLAVVSTGKYVMPFYLKEFLRQNPSVELKMDVANRSMVIQSLENNEVDFALVSISPRNMNIEEELLMTNKLFLAGSPDQLPGPQKKFNETIFENIPLIYREEGSGTRQKMQHYFEKTGIHPRIKLELTSTEAVKQAVLAGLGYSILPLLSIRPELIEKNIQIIPVKGLPLKSEWKLIWQRQKKFSLVAKTFLEHIRKHKDSIYKQHFKWTEAY